MQILPLEAIAVARVIVIPGPIYGVLSFSPILILGIVKAVRMKSRRVESSPLNMQKNPF